MPRTQVPSNQIYDGWPYDIKPDERVVVPECHQLVLHGESVVSGELILEGDLINEP